MITTKLRHVTFGVIVLGLVALGAGMFARGAPPRTKVSSFLAIDAFDGKFLLNWQPVRGDPSHVSLTKFPGQLTITTQRGSIYEDPSARGEPAAKNIFVMDNPLGENADFVMTTSISEFEPNKAYQQAMLICYNDDDNYVKLSYEYKTDKGNGQKICLVRETDGKTSYDPGEEVSDLKRVWLRLTKRGDQYEYAASKDGKKFTVYGERPWGDGPPKKIGILAKNGGMVGVPEIDARFDFFELRTPVPPAERGGIDKPPGGLVAPARP
jgi:regulation of enolase protein 1 (concanavalin A-like superfamily)